MANNETPNDLASIPDMAAPVTWNRGPSNSPLNMACLVFANILRNMLARFNIRRDTLPPGMLNASYINLRILTRIVTSEVHVMNAIDRAYAFPDPYRSNALQHIYDCHVMLITILNLAGNATQRSDRLLRAFAVEYRTTENPILCKDVDELRDAFRNESWAYYHQLDTVLDQISAKEFALAPHFAMSHERVMQTMDAWTEVPAMWEDAHIIDMTDSFGRLREPLRRHESGSRPTYGLRPLLDSTFDVQTAHKTTVDREEAAAEDAAEFAENFVGFGPREHAALALGAEVFEEEQARDWDGILASLEG